MADPGDTPLLPACAQLESMQAAAIRRNPSTSRWREKPSHGEFALVNYDWTKEDIAAAVQRLAPDFPHYSETQLMAAVQLCGIEEPFDSGLEALIEHTRRFLRNCAR